MSTYIRTFWLSHPDYWIAQGKQQAVADRVIYDKFQKYDFTQEDDLGTIIYLDQFMRHFSRIQTVSESLIQDCRVHAASITEGLTDEQRNALSESELVWYLMPWKHLHQWKPIFQTIDTWTHGQSITKFPHLNRFFMDTYRKAYTPAAVSEMLHLASPTTPTYNPDEICESHPAELCWSTYTIPQSTQKLLNALDVSEPMTISLSGGVDSMVMAALLKRKSADVVAAHIVYGNREDSVAEQNFITIYCQKLGIPLYIYKVEWLRRGTCDRAFYEEMTRQLRFSVYKALERPAFLGHIQEDAVENVWTNFAKGTHLDNLVKFQAVATEDGVQICRPWLLLKKHLIYETAEVLGIPHLKNTTPAWSNRGKFRTEFYNATHIQYGENIDEKVLEVAEQLRSQAILLDRLLYEPIRKSWNPATRRLNITSAIKADIKAEAWQTILTDLTHTRLGIGKPSFAAASDFAGRIGRVNTNGQHMCLRKDFVVRIIRLGEEVYLEVK
jgi:tRNA(Ile)-lysidine synthetase-like protein